MKTPEAARIASLFRVALFAASVAPCAAASGQSEASALDRSSLTSLRMEERDAMAFADPEPEGVAESHERFGKQGQWWLSVTGGPSFGAVDTAYWGNVSLSFSKFIADDFELGAEIGGWWFNQHGDDAEGLSLIANFRWHWWHDEADRWTAFVDTGIGILGSTEPVPATGLSFNFMPRAGVGVTHRFGEGPERLVLGVRWQHISNARIRGSERNPGRDAVMIYAGVEFPF